MCGNNPEAVDLNNRPQWLSIYGYDLLSENVRVVLTHRNGQIDISNWVAHPSPYSMTVNTSPVGAPLCNLEDRKIRVVGSGRGILVAQPGGSGVLGEFSSIDVIPTNCPGAPEPAPEKPAFGPRKQSFSGGPWGKSRDYVYGDLCSPNFHRTRVAVERVNHEGVAHCKFKRWKNADNHSCTAIVHFGAEATDNITAGGNRHQTSR